MMSEDPRRRREASAPDHLSDAFFEAIAPVEGEAPGAVTFSDLFGEGGGRGPVCDLSNPAALNAFRRRHGVEVPPPEPVSPTARAVNAVTFLRDAARTRTSSSPSGERPVSASTYPAIEDSPTSGVYEAAVPGGGRRLQVSEARPAPRPAPHYEPAPARPAAFSAEATAHYRAEAQAQAASDSMAPRGRPAAPLDEQAELEALLDRAEAALDGGRYRMGLALLQEAQQAAPLRTDIKHLLRAAMMLQARHVPPSSEPSGVHAPPSIGYRQRVAREVRSDAALPPDDPGDGGRFLPARVMTQLARYKRPAMPILGAAIAAVVLLAAIGLGWPILTSAAQDLLEAQSPGEQRAALLADQARTTMLKDPEAAIEMLAEAADQKDLGADLKERLREMRADAEHRIGDELFAAGDTEGAAERYASAVRLAPDNAAYLGDLGTAQYYRANRSNIRRGDSGADKEALREALDTLETALEIDPDNPKNLNLAAEIHVRLGQAHLAIGLWQRVLDAVDDPDNVYYGHAQRSLRNHGALSRDASPKRASGAAPSRFAQADR